MAELVRMTVREQIGAADPAAVAPGVTVRVLDLAGQFYVTGEPALAPNTRADTDPYRLWLAPDRTLVVYEMRRALPLGRFVSDVTDGLAVFEISGPRAGDMFAASTTLDPAGPVLAPGRCAQTLLGGVKSLLYAHGDGFRLHAERQFAAFLLEWLRHAATALAARPAPTAEVEVR
jgi:heterotetrameric sarcosine oxidase gamma subunit